MSKDLEDAAKTYEGVSEEAQGQLDTAISDMDTRLGEEASDKQTEFLRNQDSG